MEGRNHPFRSARDAGMTSTQPQRRAARVRATSENESLSQCECYRDLSERSSSSRSRLPPTSVTSACAHRHPSRVAEAPKPRRRASPAPRRRQPPLWRLEPRATDAGRTARAHDLSPAGRLRRLADQDLSRMLEAGAAASRRRCLRRAGAPRLQSGRLAVEAAKLVNPPSDPALKPQAKSVMAAVQNCNPLPVPAQYRPFYEQWRTKTIHFDPQVAAR